MSDAPSAMKSLEGHEIDGRYKLLSKIGEGGMGVVFQAQQLSTNREVALKVVKVDTDDDTRIERFRQEIDIISGLSHPNIVRVFDTGTIKEHDLLYVVMEYIDGLSLHELMWRMKEDQDGYFKCRIRVELALEIVYQICAALTEPHRQEIIHRDLKPENILLAPSFDETVQVKVLDFGIALVLNSPNRTNMRMTSDRIPFVGTPHYMAPEQVARTQYDMRTDLYAIGVLLFEMLSGTQPFDDSNLLALLLKKSQEDAPTLISRIPGEYPYPEVAVLTDSLLSRNVDDRPQSALEIRRTIEDIRDQYRFSRVRVDASDYLDQSKIPGFMRDRKQNAQTISKLFDPWLMYSSGEPLIPRVNNTWQELGIEPPVSEVVDLSEASEDLTIKEDDLSANTWDEPQRNKMRSWNVDAAWTDSLTSQVLAEQDFHKMASWLEEDSNPSENVDQAVTTIWTPDQNQIAQFALSFKDRFESEATSSDQEEPAPSAPPKEDVEEADLPLVEIEATLEPDQEEADASKEPLVHEPIERPQAATLPEFQPVKILEVPVKSPSDSNSNLKEESKPSIPPIQFLDPDFGAEESHFPPLASSSPSAIIRDGSTRTNANAPTLDDLVAPDPKKKPLPKPAPATPPTEVSSLVLHKEELLAQQDAREDSRRLLTICMLALLFIAVIGGLVYLMLEAL